MVKEEKIDLNKEEITDDSMVENSETVKPKEKIPKVKIEKLVNETKKGSKKTNKKNPSHQWKVTDGNLEAVVDEKVFFEHSKKEYKLKENSKKIEKGEVAVLFLRDSGIAELKYVRPENGMFIVNGRYYHTNGTCNYSIGKKRIPLAVIPEWSFVPLSKREYEIILGSRYAEAQGLIIKSLENAEVVKIQGDQPQHNKPNGKVIVGIIIAAVVVIYFLSKNGGVA